MERYLSSVVAATFSYYKVYKEVDVVDSSFQGVGQVTKSPLVQLGRSPREGNGNPLQYSCLENSMERRSLLATVPAAAKSGTLLSRLTLSTSLSISI